MKDWFKKGQKTISELKTVKRNENSNNENEEESSKNNDEEQSNDTTAQQIRMRAIGELNTVVSGTGKLVEMLRQSWDGESEVDEESLQGGEYLTHFVVETPHLHADDDLDDVFLFYIRYLVNI